MDTIQVCVMLHPIFNVFFNAKSAKEANNANKFFASFAVFAPFALTIQQQAIPPNKA